MYPFERFSNEAKKVLTLAQEEAERAHHSYIGTEHLLLAILRSGSGCARLLNDMGVDEEPARAVIERILGRNQRIIIQQIIPTSRVKKVIELSFEAARREDSATVTPEHLVIGLLEEGEGIAAHVLDELGVTLEKFLGARPAGPRAPEQPWPPTGARVLVHDAEPPYRLWEGAVTGHEDGAVLVSIPDHPTTPAARVGVDLLHPVPMRSTVNCMRCSHPAEG